MHEKRYRGRYILATGEPRAFTTYAYNKSDAAAAIEREAREVLGAAFASARCEGVEPASPAVLLVAADAAGRPRRILRQITSGGRVL